ncbi:glycosyltransferase family 4 protein [Shimia thalassica]|uniref:glycosyltransferase family 4 protein n=1 Tax=Shimia thalassica TaxID=1715693 RepID=UPI0027335F57|nr:glycosyltransferase family 4 protein [Shimia thalassica]MDP2494753.1 glycosyltransferase family 4 protein [Shimia thalassica]
MNILFIHQNFPGQFKHLAPALAARGHKAVALTLRVKEPTTWNGVQILPYGLKRKPSQGLHPWLVDFESKLLRGESCYVAAKQLKSGGFNPDVIVAHPGWGESMFLKDLWPEARIGLFYELYYSGSKGDTGFDPEFPVKSSETESMRLRLKNMNNFMHLEVGDLGISPTEFQADTFPPEFRKRISVIHDGIDTKVVVPNPDVTFTLGDGQILTRQDEVITFVNRNLEPYRGYHVFMRALPELLKSRPNAQVLLVGGDEVSYGSRPPAGQTWKQIFIDEVRGRIPTSSWNRVHFLGRIPYEQFLSLLQISKAHVYLTYPFVLSWSLIEAMSAGAPIVASDTAPLHEAITHEKTGLLFPFFDGEALVANVNRVLNDPELAAEMGKAARALAVEKYDLETVCLPQQLEWIERLANMTAGEFTY